MLIIFTYPCYSDISALFVALAAQDGFEKRGGDARFATGVMGSSFNRIGDYFLWFLQILTQF